MISTAAAPSVICDELPAVITPSGLNAGFSVASFSSVVSGRMPSSWSTMRLAVVGSVTSTGTISRSKRPSSRGAARPAGATATDELVVVLARDAPLLGDELGRDALRHEVRDSGSVIIGAEREAVLAVGDRRAHRHAASWSRRRRRSRRRSAPAITPCAAKCDRLLRRAALAVDRGADGTDSGKPAASAALRRDVDALLADLRDAAHDHVLDERGIDVVALDERAAARARRDRRGASP